MSKNVLDFKKYANLNNSSLNEELKQDATFFYPSGKVINNKLSKQLKQEQDIFINSIIELEKNEEILKLIQNNKSIPSELSKTPVLDGIFGFICLIFVIILGVLLWNGIWIAALIFLVGMGFIINLLEYFTKYKTKKKIIHSNKIFNKKFDECVERLVVLFDELLPEIHELGLFDVENVKNKTSAKLLNLDFIQSIIIDRELDEGRVEKIQFTDQKSKQSQILYKSLIADESGSDDMEHIELQID